MIGKPYSGKPTVRFDEGELEIEPSATTPALYSTVIRRVWPMVLSGVSLAMGAGRIGRYHSENQPRGLSGCGHLKPAG